MSADWQVRAAAAAAGSGDWAVEGVGAICHAHDYGVSHVRVSCDVRQIVSSSVAHGVGKYVVI